MWTKDKDDNWTVDELENLISDNFNLRRAQVLRILLKEINAIK